MKKTNSSYILNIINQKLICLNPSINDIKRNKFWNISKKLGFELYKLTKNQNPKSVLEIGTSNGYSSLWILKSLYEKNNHFKFYTIEINEERFKLAKKVFNEIDNKYNITQLRGEAENILRIYDFNCKFDFIFIDAAQKKYKLLTEILLKRDLLDKNCKIVYDNILSHKHMDNFLNWIKTKTEFKFKIVKIDSGFLIVDFISSKC